MFSVKYLKNWNESFSETVTRNFAILGFPSIFLWFSLKKIIRLQRNNNVFPEYYIVTQLLKTYHFKAKSFLSLPTIDKSGRNTNLK